MSTYTVTTFGLAMNSQYGQGTMFAVGAALAVVAPTELMYSNPDGSRVVIRGSGFVFSGSTPLAGIIDSVEHRDSPLTTLFASYTAVGVPILDLHNRWFGPSSFPELALTAGDDLMVGSTNADTFNGAGGNDTINAGDGNDYIDPGDGADTVNGGNGNDMLSYSAANADAAITKGITVNLNLTTLVDPWGNVDTISSIENVRSTRFADTLIGNASANRFEPLAGADTIAGGDGFDTVNYLRDTRYGGTKGVTVNLAIGSATDGFGDQDSFTGIEGASGTDQADTLIGGDTPLSGLSYEAYGLGGDDTIKAGSFDMYIEPGAGNDTITGGASFNDQVSYQEYTGTKGATMNLATGVVNDPYGGTDTITGGIEGLRGTPNADTLIGNSSGNFLRGLAGNDTLDGGGGFDTVRYDRDAARGGTKGVVVDLGTGTATDGFGDTDTLISIERVAGTNSADVLTAGDAVLELNNRYTLIGLGGDDTLKARSQAVYFEPGAGNDTIAGSPGNDLLSYADYTGSVGLVLDLGLGKVSDPFGGIDTFTSIESVRGTRNADTLLGDGQDNQFQGLGGADVITGGAGIDEVRYDADTSYGGTNSVMVDLQAGTGTDAFGTGSVDTLSGIEGIRGTNSLEPRSISLDGKTIHTDVLYGDGGDNFFRGLRGADLIDGRGGTDTADYSRDAGAGGKAGVAVDLAAHTGSDGFGTLDTLRNIENVIGTDYADTIKGDGAANVLTGLLGDDILDGAGGSDTAVFAGASASYTVTAGPGGTLVVSDADGKDTLSNIEFLKFSDVTVAVKGGGGTVASTFSIATLNPTLAEGTGTGTTSFTFRITRTGATAQAQSIGWSVGGIGKAPADAKDFALGVLPQGTVAFAAGETERTVSVAVQRDTAIEPNETFAVALKAPPAGGTIGIGSAQSVIVDDDTSYSVTGGGEKSETTGGTRTFTFTVQRAGIIGGTGSVAFTVKGSGMSPADAADFVGSKLPSGTVSFLKDEASKPVTVAVAGDAKVEPNETFTLVLSDAKGGSVATETATATILNDDSVLSIAATSANKPEGTGGTGATTPFTFTVTRTGGAGVAQTVKWAVAGVTQTGTEPADAADFAGGLFPSGVLTFAANETSRVISVPVAADTKVELNERFSVTLSNPTNGATISTIQGANRAQGIIVTDDTNLRVVAGGAMTQAEGHAGSRSFSFQVQRNGITSGTSTVFYTVAGTGAAKADAADFSGGKMPSGMVTFLAGETSKTIRIDVAGDSKREQNEGFELTLSKAAGATISVASLGAVIQNDDSEVLILSTDAYKPEGNGPAGATTPFRFRIVRDGALGFPQTVDYVTTGLGSSTNADSASAADFASGVFPAGKITFAAGEASRTITLNVRADETPERNESFQVALVNPTGGATIHPNPLFGKAQGVIITDDFASTAGDDSLTGTSGSDLFLLQAGGNDVVSGGPGVDRFRFLPSATVNDTLDLVRFVDFNPAAGEKIDLSAVDADPGVPGNQSFALFFGVPWTGVGPNPNLPGPNALATSLLGYNPVYGWRFGGNGIPDFYVARSEIPTASWFIL